MQIVAVIPARYNSTRLPGKPLADVWGKPLLQYTYERVSEVYDNVWVATDDERVISTVKRFGGDVIYTSPNHLCGTDRCAEAARYLQLRNEDVIINVQCDQPLVPLNGLAALQFTILDGHNIATLVSDVSPADYYNPNYVKVTCDNKRYAKTFDRKQIKQGKNFYHIGVYAFNNLTLQHLAYLNPTDTDTDLEQLRWLKAGFKVFCVYSKLRGFSVDTTDDLRVFKRLMIK